MVQHQDYTHSGPYSHCRGNCGNKVVAALDELCASCRAALDAAVTKVEDVAGEVVQEAETVVEEVLHELPPLPPPPSAPEPPPVALEPPPTHVGDGEVGGASDDSA